jgi:hypothetical protein
VAAPASVPNGERPDPPHIVQDLIPTPRQGMHCEAPLPLHEMQRSSLAPVPRQVKHCVFPPGAWPLPLHIVHERSFEPTPSH